LNELDREIEIQQTRKRLAHHRPWEHVAADDYMVDVSAPHVLENGFQRRKVSVNVVKGRNPPSHSG
jgi:hypothetical protein